MCVGGETENQREEGRCVTPKLHFVGANLHPAATKMGNNKVGFLSVFHLIPDFYSLQYLLYSDYYLINKYLNFYLNKEFLALLLPLLSSFSW